jgi:hypothetical protein
MAQVIDLSSRRTLFASKAYSETRGEPFVHVGNLIMHEVRGMEEHAETVKSRNNIIDCDQSEELLMEFLDGDLDQVSQSRVEKHLSVCATCQEKLEEFKSLKIESRKISSEKFLSQEIKTRLRKRLSEELGLRLDV